LTTALGVVAALVRREVSGRGDTVEVSAQEVELGLNRTTVSRGLNEGRDFDRTYEGYGWQGTLRAADGWVCLRPNEDRHWQAFTAEIGRPELATDPRFATYEARFAHGVELHAELEAWTTTVDRAHIRHAMSVAGVPGAPYLEPHEVLTDPVIGSREVFEDAPTGGRFPRLPLRLAARGPVPEACHTDDARSPALAARLASGVTGEGPLAGLRVLDLTWVASGPYATLLLRSLGAEVFKVEAPDRPDLFRRSHGSDDDPDAGLRFVDLNQGKRSLALDLKAPGGRGVFTRLVTTCDVLVENFRVGVRDQLGIGDEDLWALNPTLATVSLSGFGADASDRHRPGYASVFSAEGGISAMTGYPDAAPTDVRDSNDLRGGTAAGLAAVAAVLECLRSGHAAPRTGVAAIDLAMRDAVIWLQGDVFLQASRGRRPTRSENALEGCPAHGCWPTSDGRYVAVGARTRAEHAQVAQVLGQPVTTAFDEVADALAAWLAETTSAEAVDRLGRAGVPVSPTCLVSDLAADPHLAERGVLRRAEHPRLGVLWLVNGPIRCHESGWLAAPVASPLLGEHTSEEFGP
jgi:crotonobetainyl-CoA:carnitine CoA-transferase CaiB-like acyl-CoA transferase